jgi:hypothetical protein
MLKDLKKIHIRGGSYWKFYGKEFLEYVEVYIPILICPLIIILFIYRSLAFTVKPLIQPPQTPPISIPFTSPYNHHLLYKGGVFFSIFVYFGTFLFSLVFKRNKFSFLGKKCDFYSYFF